ELLDAGQLGGAALDVFESEPPPPDSPLLRSDRVVLYPHAAGATAQSVLRILQTVVANIGRAVGGEPVEHVVNGVDPVVRRRG
ncbi:MAG: hypothetical protein LC640_05770, partial [Frankia sp.]|nr:hypothetical protein [Frankia sp.]